MSHTYKRHDERLAEFLDTALGQRFGAKSVKEFTMYRMAKWTGLAPSNKLKKMLDELVSDGYLNRVERPHRGNVIKHVYSLSAEALERFAIL